MLTLMSPAFVDGGEIPRRHTCEGPDLSPELRIDVDVHGVKSLALIVDDPDAPDPKAPQSVWCHWVLYNLPVTMTELLAGARSSSLPKGAREGRNDWGKTGYRGPSPDVGRHRYLFKLFALDVILPDLKEPTKKQLLDAMKHHVLDEAVLIGTYEKRQRADRILSDLEHETV
jgi:Raf kinase inhibitor-like YbhB/YbcL family protein